MGSLAQVTVVTYLGMRKLCQYKSINSGGVEVLVSVDMARFVRSLHIKLDRFLFLRNLKAQVNFSNGLVLGGPVPPNVGSIHNQPWAWRPR